MKFKCFPTAVEIYDVCIQGSASDCVAKVKAFDADCAEVEILSVMSRDNFGGVLAAIATAVWMVTEPFDEPP